MSNRVADYIKGVSEEYYQVNQMLQYALVRNIEVVGEAVKNSFSCGAATERVKS